MGDLVRDKIAYNLREKGKSWSEIVADLKKAGIKMGRSTIRDAYKREKARRAKKSPVYNYTDKKLTGVRV